MSMLLCSCSYASSCRSQSHISRTRAVLACFDSFSFLRSNCACSPLLLMGCVAQLFRRLFEFAFCFLVFEVSLFCCFSFLPQYCEIEIGVYSLIQRDCFKVEFTVLFQHPVGAACINEVVSVCLAWFIDTEDSEMWICALNCSKRTFHRIAAIVPVVWHCDIDLAELLASC